MILASTVSLRDYPLVDVIVFEFSAAALEIDIYVPFASQIK